MEMMHEDEVMTELEKRAQACGRFGQVTRSPEELVCLAKASGAPAHYTVRLMGTHWHIALLTSDRWLSESIESQLVESREEPEALLLEELRDLDWSEGEVAIRHFRDDSKQYVFESTLAVRGAPGELSRVWTLLAAYERTFSQLGEMSSGEGG